MLPQRLEGVVDVWRKWEEDPPSHDGYIRAHAQAMQADFINHGPMSDFMSDWLRANANISSSYAASKLLRAIQRQLYGHYEGYPSEFLTPQEWEKGTAWIVTDADRYGQFFSDVWTRPLQSNKSERYKALKAFGVLARSFGRLGIFSVMDVGASQNAGLNHLASGVGFESPTVIRPGTRARTSLGHTAAFSAIMSRELPLDRAVGIDLTWPEDSREWAWSCSHYPGELLDQERVDLFNALIEADYPTVGFFKGDFVNFDDVAFRTRFAGRDTFKIVNFCTMLYQATEEERTAMLDRAAEYAEEFIAVQDFVRIDPNDPTHLIFRDNWQDEPYPYRMVVRDLRSKNPRQWREIFLWRDGRCRELTIGMGRLAITPESTTSVWGAINRRANPI